MVILVHTFLGFLLRGLCGSTWATHDHGLLPDIGRDHVLSSCHTISICSKNFHSIKCYIGLPSIISSCVRPCTLCIVVAQASVSGNCNRVNLEPHLHFAWNITSCSHKGTTLGKLAWHGLVWIALMPTYWLSNMTSTLVTMRLAWVTSVKNFSSCCFNKAIWHINIATSITHAPIASLS